MYVMTRDNTLYGLLSENQYVTNWSPYNKSWNLPSSTVIISGISEFTSGQLIDMIGQCCCQQIFKPTFTPKFQSIFPEKFTNSELSEDYFISHNVLYNYWSNNRNDIL